ncbi:hypothetical protein ACQ4PT_018613 [Festuca glaucescens]
MVARSRRFDTADHGSGSPEAYGRRGKKRWQRRCPVARYPALAEPLIQYCPLLASCDGLLLLGIARATDGGAEQYLIYNPTRQWSDLSRPSRDARQKHRESGFYIHEPSGKYRLLYYATIELFISGQASYYCILSAGSDMPRRLSVQATPIEQIVASLAVLHGQLHWLQHTDARLTGQMVVFDTVAETFRQMPPPPVTLKKNSDLLVADGSLMACELGHLFMDGGPLGARQLHRRHWKGEVGAAAPRRGAVASGQSAGRGW